MFYLTVFRPSRRGTYFMKFVFCELLNLVNVFVQIYFTDVFLGYQFTKFGREVFAVSEQDLNTRVDPMHKVFPKVAKCQFNKYGPSGSIQNHDALCVLPLNIINEKIYIFLYFWFVFLAAVSCVWLIYRLLTIFSHDLRVNIIYARSDRRVGRTPLVCFFLTPPLTVGRQTDDLGCSLQPETFRDGEAGRLLDVVPHHKECQSSHYKGGTYWFTVER